MESPPKTVADYFQWGIRSIFFWQGTLSRVPFLVFTFIVHALCTFLIPIFVMHLENSSFKEAFELFYAQDSQYLVMLLRTSFLVGLCISLIPVLARVPLDAKRLRSIGAPVLLCYFSPIFTAFLSVLKARNKMESGLGTLIGIFLLLYFGFLMLAPDNYLKPKTIAPSQKQKDPTE